ncbi:MAG: class I SAM-dependent methyltransferase [Phycisphaeraceae bacterium]|nr:class I SAM-dependent methyltransferase [Phycisphaeraceae bacterium]
MTNTNLVQQLYEQQPYPVPPTDMSDFVNGQMFPAGSPKDYFHLYWPDKPFRQDLEILIAGCGTAQATEFAITNPKAHITAIDLSSRSLEHTKMLLEKYNCSNVTLHQMSLELVGTLGQQFDLIICTGVLHHMPDPDVGLVVLRECLKSDGRLLAMVYATYGRTGVYMFQEYCRLLGVTWAPGSCEQMRQVLKQTPADHPIVSLAKRTHDLLSDAGMADLLLHPQDRAYTVGQLMQWLDDCGLGFERWLMQAPYLPRCCVLAQTPHMTKLNTLPMDQQYAAVELFRGNIHIHTFIASALQSPSVINWETDQWKTLVPIRMRGVTVQTENLPAGALASLQQAGHLFPVASVLLTQSNVAMYQAIEQGVTLGEISKKHPQTRDFFKMLWDFDQVFFRRA